MRRRHFQATNPLVSSAGLMSYVPCPNPRCGDPVAGRIPQSPEVLRLTCVHCKESFTFQQDDVRRGLVSYNRSTDRWWVQSL